MSYFPAFLRLENTKVLIVGGGKVAYEKLLRLLEFTDDISIVASELSIHMQELIDKNSLSFEISDYKKGYIKDFQMVVVAVDDLILQEEIFKESRAYRCLCNCVDSIEYCDFIFPSYIKKESLTIAVSTSGTSPATAKYIRKYLQKLIPDEISLFLDEMKSLRKSFPKGKERMKMLDEKARKYVEKWDKREQNDG